MSEKKRIYIVVKTYPTISKEYSELVCTAGILEDGSWIRLYPVPFRRLDDYQKYPKYTWIEVEVERNTKDFRPESFRPTLTTISVAESSKKIDWDDRRRIIFNNTKVFTNLQELCDKAKSDYTSLAIFKPTKILDFIAEPVEREWNAEKLASLRNLSMQLNIFQSAEEIEEEYKVVPKVPYKFSYSFEDDSRRRSTLMIEDWEIGMLYVNCLKQANGDEKTAISKVRAKYYDFFLKRDLFFFLGTTLKFHMVSKTPFVIVGIFYPPELPPNNQPNLFDL